MPVGSPKAQTIATKKYQQKVGIVSKSFKLKKELVDRFSETCKVAGVSMSSQVARMMEEFIESVNEEKY
jgi:hypothetical protein